MPESEGAMASDYFKKLVREFKTHAEVSPDGKTISLDGYNAKQDEVSSLLPYHILPFWNISSPGIKIADGVEFPGSRIVLEGGCATRRTAINVMAQCAARDVISGSRPSPLPK